MREILFRGKSKINGEWVYGFYSGENCSGIFSPMFKQDNIIIKGSGFWVEVEAETVGEFTGLTDENGVKIFEGDIIKRKRTDGNWYNYEVFWWDNCWGIKNGVSQCLIIPQCGVQLSGNIYDNPELLGEGSDENERQE